MKILPLLHPSTRIWMTCLIVAIALGASTSLYLFQQNQRLQQSLSQINQVDQAAEEQASLTLIQQQSLTSQTDQLQSTIEQLQSELPQQTQTLDKIYTLYQTTQDKLTRNSALGLNNQSITDKLPGWGKLLLDQNFDQLTQKLNQANIDLDKSYHDKQQQLATRPTPTLITQTNNGVSTNGYSQQNVNTPLGTFAAKIIKLPLSQYQVRTVSGSPATCANNCVAKPLAQYIAESGAYAGINGTYFCPPDYPSCAGKTYSYDFAFFNSLNGQWANPAARGWDSTGMITFTGTTAQGCRISQGCNTSGVTAAISNFPPLIVHNGQAQNIPGQTKAQSGKNSKGALGVNDQHIFLVTTSGTSLNDLAQVMKSLGVTHALNLDGGGSQALHIAGAYKAGPGRLLPNAIVLVRR